MKDGNDTSNDEPIDPTVECHAHISQWNKDHASFKVIHKHSNDSAIYRFILYHHFRICPSMRVRVRVLKIRVGI